MLPKRWVFLRGLARERRHWGDFVDVFQARFPGTEIHAIDLPGIGEFRNIESPTSMTGITEFVRTEARKQMPDGKFAVLALSLGGMVAMEWMNTFADDLESVVLINSSAKDSRFYHRLRYQVWSDFVAVLTTTNLREREKKLIDIIINSEEGKAKAFPLWAKIAVEQPVKFSTFAKQLLAASRFSGIKNNSRVPVLVLNSLGDRLVDPGCSEALHQKFQWRLERHPWAGHDLTWDDAAWVTDYIHRFFS